MAYFVLPGAAAVLMLSPRRGARVSPRVKAALRRDALLAVDEDALSGRFGSVLEADGGVRQEMR